MKLDEVSKWAKVSDICFQVVGYERSTPFLSSPHHHVLVLLTFMWNLYFLARTLERNMNCAPASLSSSLSERGSIGPDGGGVGLQMIRYSYLQLPYTCMMCMLFSLHWAWQKIENSWNELSLKTVALHRLNANSHAARTVPDQHRKHNTQRLQQ